MAPTSDLPPPPPGDPEMGDELGDAWERYDILLRRCNELERIADRLAATSVDPVAVDEWHEWKTGGSS